MPRLLTFKRNKKAGCQSQVANDVRRIRLTYVGNAAIWRKEVTNTRKGVLQSRQDFITIERRGIKKKPEL
jgi:hypothetical protein